MPEKKKRTAGEKYDEAAGALMRAIDARRSGNANPYDRLGEYASKQSGTPGELLPPYREAFARDRQFEDYTHPGYIEERAFSRSRNAPVRQEDVEAMQEMFERPGERPQMGVDVALPYYEGTGLPSFMMPSDFRNPVRTDKEAQFWRGLERTFVKKKQPRPPATKKGK